eukprot:scaffold271_cov17-Tisochrysis_lutea.AAC.2
MELVGDILAELDDIPGTSPKQPGLRQQPLSSSSSSSASRPPHHLPLHTHSQPSLTSAQARHTRAQSTSQPNSQQTQHAKRASLPGSKPADLHSSINDLLNNLVRCSRVAHLPRGAHLPTLWAVASCLHEHKDAYMSTRQCSHLLESAFQPSLFATHGHRTWMTSQSPRLTAGHRSQPSQPHHQYHARQLAERPPRSPSP